MKLHPNEPSGVDLGINKEISLHAWLELQEYSQYDLSFVRSFPMTADISEYLSGDRLYGDDFSQEQLLQWHADEAEGYANLGAKDKGSYRYAYHQLNQCLAFEHIRGRRFERALGIGSAYGDEFQPIANNINHITILDPSDAFAHVTEVLETPCEYVKPNPYGHLLFETNSFDLITSLGVMHHIPNVSYVMNECHRCLSEGGVMLLREPITSMGDWRKPRLGLTKRERGVPLKILDKIVHDCKFKVVRRSFLSFNLVLDISRYLGVAPYNNRLVTNIDSLLARAFAWNIRYHRTRLYEKQAPNGVYYVLQK